MRDYFSMSFNRVLYYVKLQLQLKVFWKKILIIPIENTFE